MNPTQLAILKANTAAFEGAERRIKQQLDRDSTTQTIGSYQGYNADIGMHQVMVQGGGIINARSLSNAGQQKGDNVALAYSGMSAYMRALSR